MSMKSSKYSKIRLYIPRIRDYPYNIPEFFSDGIGSLKVPALKWNGWGEGILRDSRWVKKPGWFELNKGLY